MKNLRYFFVAIAILGGGATVEAQQPKKVPLIGVLFAATPSANSERIEAFRQGLRERGYVEGKDILIEQRYAEGNFDRLPALAADLVHLKVDVIVSASSAGTRSLKEATNTIPIVTTSDTDPVGNKVVASLARPGGNITGLSVLAPELSGKRLELLKEIVLKLSRVAVLGTSTNATTAQVLREMELAAPALKVQLQYLDVQGPKDIETAFREATTSQPRNQKSTPGNICRARIRGRRRPYELRRELYRLVPAGRCLRRQNPQRRQARGSSRRAAEKV